MICPYCKAEIDDDAKKCKNCGEWVNKTKDFPKREFGKTIAFAFFFGVFGVHRFHTGYKKIGTIQLILTITLLGILVSGVWAFVDLVSISLNKYKDSLNRSLLNYKKNFGIAILIIASLCMLYNISNGIEGWNNTDTTKSMSSVLAKNEETPAKTSQKQVGADFVPDSDAPKTLLLLENHECKTDLDAKAICGTILNNSDRNLSYAQISINLYDANDALIESAMDNINNLGAGEKWKFEVGILTDKPIKKYKVKEIIGH